MRDREPGRVLWATEEVPDRNLGGGNIREAHLVEALAEAVPTDLLVVGRLTDERVRAAAASVTELPRREAVWAQQRALRRVLQLAIAFGPHPMQGYFARPGRRALAQALARSDQDHDLVIVINEALAPLLPASQRIPWVIELQHLFSVMADQQLRMAAGFHRRWLWKLERRKARRFERRIVGGFDRVIVCSDEDAAELRELGGSAAAGKIAVIPNGVDLARFPVTPVPTEPRIVFPGTLAYLPNVDGAQWFCTEVLPRIRAAVPGVTFDLVGRDPVPEVLALARLPGVSVHANVPEMAPYFQAARLIVVPLRVGTGTRLKALEAMAAARPVVGTATGLEGIGIIDGEHARVVDDAGRMADATITLLRDDALARRLAAAGRAHVETRYGWDRIGAELVALVTEMLAPSLTGAASGT